jgi:endonuclease YncB( thermonuclease family)
MNCVAKLLTALAVLICSSVVAPAATLQAKVVEVPTGNSLVVSNTSRSVRVRLKSVVPPEVGQPFSDAARDHLRMLVLDQTVMVDYTHLADGYLEARVFLKGVDIGSQMLRDGVAWYDHATDYELNETDRELYAQCEQAARTEKRGLWKDESPLAPWEFRRVQQAKINDIVNGRTSSLSNPNPRPKPTSLSTADLMGDFSGGSLSSNVFPGLRPIVQNGSADRWTSFASPYSHFSVMIPSNGVEGSIVTQDANGQPIALDVVKALGARAHLLLIAGRWPDTNLTDSSFIDKSIHDLIKSINEEKGQRGRSASEILSLKPVRDLKLAGYSGRQYDLRNEWFSGTVRVFTKRSGSDRQLFVLLTLSLPGGEGIADQFLNSFKFTE